MFRGVVGKGGLKIHSLVSGLVVIRSLRETLADIDTGQRCQTRTPPRMHASLCASAHTQTGTQTDTNIDTHTHIHIHVRTRACSRMCASTHTQR